MGIEPIRIPLWKIILHGFYRTTLDWPMTQRLVSINLLNNPNIPDNKLQIQLSDGSAILSASIAGGNSFIPLHIERSKNDRFLLKIPFDVIQSYLMSSMRHDVVLQLDLE